MLAWAIIGFLGPLNSNWVLFIPLILFSRTEPTSLPLLLPNLFQPRAHLIHPLSFNCSSRVRANTPEGPRRLYSCLLTPRGMSASPSSSPVSLVSPTSPTSPEDDKKGCGKFPLTPCNFKVPLFQCQSTKRRSTRTHRWDGEHDISHWTGPN